MIILASIVGAILIVRSAKRRFEKAQPARLPMLKMEGFGSVLDVTELRRRMGMPPASGPSPEETMEVWLNLARDATEVAETLWRAHGVAQHGTAQLRHLLGLAVLSATDPTDGLTDARKIVYASMALVAERDLVENLVSSGPACRRLDVLVDDVRRDMRTGSTRALTQNVYCPVAAPFLAAHLLTEENVCGMNAISECIEQVIGLVFKHLEQMRTKRQGI